MGDSDGRGGGGITLHFLGVLCNSLRNPVQRVSWKLPPLLQHYSAAGDGSPEPQREDITYGGRAISSSPGGEDAGLGQGEDSRKAD